MVLTRKFRTFFLLGLCSLSFPNPTWALLETPEMASAEFRRMNNQTQLVLKDSQGMEIAVREMNLRRGLDLLEMDIPGIRYSQPRKTLTHTIPGINLFVTSRLSNDPPVVRLTLFPGSKENMNRLAPRLEEGKLLLDGEPQTKEPLSTRLPPETLIPVKSSPTVGQPSKSPVEIASLDAEIIDLDFDDAELMEILKALAMKKNVALTTDGGIQGRLTIHSHNASLRDVLDSLLLPRGLKYKLTDQSLTVISPNRNPFNQRLAKELIFKDMSLKDALQTMSRMLSINLIMHESVPDKSINFYVENLEIEELFALLLQTNGLIKKQYNQNTFIILADNKSGAYGTLVFKTYKLINTKPEIIQAHINAVESFKKLVNMTNWAVDKELNHIVVNDTPEAHMILEKIIASTEEKPRQATIEMKLLEISRNGAKDLGFEIINGLSMSPNNVLPRAVDLAAKLSFLERTSKARVLASPQVRAMNKKSASIHIGETIPVPYSDYAVGTVTSSGVVDSGSVSSQNRQQLVTQEVKKFKDVPVGIQLQVTPEIFRDKEVELDVNIQVDTVLNITAEGQIHKSTKNTNTKIRVKDGETVIFGGLIQQKDSNSIEAPPFLNRIPWLSSLFRNRKDIQDSELVLLLTPHVVNTDIEAPLPVTAITNKSEPKTLAAKAR